MARLRRMKKCSRSVKCSTLADATGAGSPRRRVVPGATMRNR